jgi:hypothetical protein
MRAKILLHSAQTDECWVHNQIHTEHPSMGNLTQSTQTRRVAGHAERHVTHTPLHFLSLRYNNTVSGDARAQLPANSAFLTTTESSSQGEKQEENRSESHLIQRLLVTHRIVFRQLNSHSVPLVICILHHSLEFASVTFTIRKVRGGSYQQARVLHAYVYIKFSKSWFVADSKMFASAVSTTKLNPVAARQQRSVIARAGKYDEELIKTAVRLFASLC